jgi:cell division protease FtsH
MEFDDDAPRKEESRPKKPRSFVLFLLLMIMAAVLLWVGRGIAGGPDSVEVSLPEYLEQKQAGNIKDVTVRGDLLEATMQTGFSRDRKDYKRIYTKLPPAVTEDWTGFKLLQEGLPAGSFHYQKPSLFLEQVILTFVPWIVLIILVWYFFFRQIRASGGPRDILSFGRSRARFITADKVKTTFADVAGVDEAREDVGEIVEFLKNPQKFTRLGGRIPRGVLLVGPPGTGKTLLAKAIAGEAGVPFLSISGSDFVELFVGVGASRVRDLFEKARQHAPCIIFLDEIDAVGRRRGTGLGGGHDEREQTLNAILVEMDGFDTEEGIIVMAATNRPDVLDPALLRPGRFDRQVTIDLPDVKGREEILKIHARKIKLGRDADLREVARATPMLSGADLANIVNEAAIIATIRRADTVEISDLNEARDKIIFGRQKKSRVMEEQERKITAVHEAGHAFLSAKLLSDVLPLHKVTIIPRGRALGMTMSFPDRDRYHLPKDQCLKQLTMSFGGRVAEELFFNEISAGAANDIKSATDLARRMVCEWGMSEALGPVSYTEEEEHFFLGREIARTRNISEETQKAIDAEIRRLLENAYKEARDILTGEKAALERVSQALLKYETISGEDVRAIMRGESIDDAKERECAERRAREEKSRGDGKPLPGPDWPPPARPLPGPQQA